MENEAEFPTPKKDDVLFAGDKSIWKMDDFIRTRA
jgi:hypothetical protein